MSLYGQESALRALQDQLRGARGDDQEPVTVTSTDESGRISVEVAGGEVSALSIDARAMRDLSNAELADVVRATVNDALRRFGESRTSGVDIGAFERLLDSVGGIAAEAERDFGRQVGALDRAMQQVERLAAQQADLQRRQEAGE